jgi:hypothetical protein
MRRVFVSLISQSETGLLDDDRALADVAPLEDERPLRPSSRGGS